MLFMLSVTNKAIMLSVTSKAIMLNVIMLNVVILSVAAPISTSRGFNDEEEKIL